MGLKVIIYNKWFSFTLSVQDASCKGCKRRKRYVSEKSPLDVEELKETIAKAFRKLTESISFSKGWIEKFLGK